DHNALHQGARWHEVKLPITIAGHVNHRGGGPVLDKYVRRFGAEWVEQRENTEKRIVRLKPLDEYRSLLEEAGRFLLIPGEEIAATWKKAGPPTERSGPLHINVTNLRDVLKPVD